MNRSVPSLSQYAIISTVELMFFNRSDNLAKNPVRLGRLAVSQPFDFSRDCCRTVIRSFRREVDEVEKCHNGSECAAIHLLNIF